MFRPVPKGQRVQAVPQAQHFSLATTDPKLDPALFAGHSLRSGFLTSAAESGASVFKMMGVSRHKWVDTLRGYVRRAEVFHGHAGGVPLTRECAHHRHR